MIKNELQNKNVLPEKFVILCLDPGFTTTGWSILEYIVSTSEFHVIKYGSINVTKMTSVIAQRDSVITYGKRVIALTILKKHVRKILTSFKPDYVVAEDAFYQFGRLSAYEALVQWISNIECLLHDEFSLRLFKLSAKFIKKCMADSGAANKTNIQKAVLSNEKIVFKTITNMMNEHEADSIAIGYTFGKIVLPGLLSSDNIKNIVEKR